MLRRISIWRLALLVVLFAAAIAPPVAPLLFGWWSVLNRVIPQVEINYAGVATGVLCIGVTIFMLHRFCAWMYGEVRTKHDRADWPLAWRWPWTLGLVAAVVLAFSAGLMGVGLWRTTTWFLETPKLIDRRSGVFDGH